MDKLSRLQALTGQQDIVSQALNTNDGWDITPAWERAPKTAHSYEGVRLEDGDIIGSQGYQTSRNESCSQAPESKQLVEENSHIFAEFQNFQLGQLAPVLEEFCLLAAIKKYPYTFYQQSDSQKVAERFFDKNQLLNNNTWDLFYIHKNRTGFSDAVVLVPTKQFEQFLDKINKTLHVEPDIPFRAIAAFQVQFGIEGMPHPRYLGRSTSREMADRMLLNVPPNNFRLWGEPKDTTPTDSSIQRHNLKLASIQLIPKSEINGKGEKKKTDRTAERQAFGHSLKRVQRYLGLREKRPVLEFNPTNVTEVSPTSFAANKVAPFHFEEDIVFVSVDVEAYERDKNKITEIGISTLDTRDLAKLAPGQGGQEWMKAIRHRHFLIKDYKHLRNKDFVRGCPDRFEFGESEFITLAESPKVVASCFKHPFSAPGEVASISDEAPKRNIVLVGHDVRQDVRYLRRIGYSVYNLSNLLEKVDTASMWRYLTREPNPRSLGTILAELGITAWNLHNAGNDAAYTLQAMIGIAIKAIADKAKGAQILEIEKLKGVSQTVAEGQIGPLARAEELESSPESDGGSPVKPIRSKSSRNEPWPQQSTPAYGQPDHTSRDPWQENAMNSGDWTQDDSAEKGGWATTTEPPAWENNSWDSPANLDQDIATDGHQTNLTSRPHDTENTERDSYQRVAAHWSPSTGHITGAEAWANIGGESNEFVATRDVTRHQNNRAEAWGNAEDNDDGIPAGYSPGYRNNPIGAGSRVHSSNLGLSAPPKSSTQNSQPSAIGSSVTIPQNYQPTARNPVHRLMNMYNQENPGENFGGEYQDGIDDLEGELHDMEVSDHGRKGHVDAW